VLNNQTILDSPILLFLGAGASQPLEKPMMSEFVAKLSTAITDDSQKRVLAYLRKFRGEDLEAILGELDTIIGLDYASYVNGYESGSQFSLGRDIARYLQTNIKHAIIREYRNVNGEKAAELYEPLFNVVFPYIKKGSQCLTIFTTNYDPAIEVFCQRAYGQYTICDGFAHDPADRHYYWSRSVFDRFQLEPEKRNLTLFKLHGSVDWLRVKASQRIRRGQAMFDAMDSDAYENILIYPVTRKIATEDPFYTGYEYFERCSERAKVCIAIGYSFRDYDALTRLRGAASLNDSLNLALVAPRAEETLRTVQIPDERKMPFNSKFGQLPGQLNQLSEYLDKTIRASKATTVA